MKRGTIIPVGSWVKARKGKVMNSQNRKALILFLGAMALVIVSAGAAAFVTRSQPTEDKTAPQKITSQKAVSKNTARKEEITWNDQQPPPPQAKPCDDGNIVGAAIGGAAGGLIGNQFGSGKGKDLATIGGVIAGGTAGHQLIPTRGTLCR